MSISESNVIDVIGIDKMSGSVVLTISNHLPWGAESLLQLQEKLNKYIEFIESNEIYSSYPDAVNRNIEINVVCKYEPNEEAGLFLSRAAAVLKVVGAVLTYGALNNEYTHAAP